MDEYDEIESAVSILPGVDLTLWLRLVLLALVVGVTTGLVLGLT